MTAPVSPSAPVAWRLVPVEPTEAMLDNAACYEHAPALKSIYAAMLAASPALSMVGLREKVAEALYTAETKPPLNLPGAVTSCVYAPWSEVAEWQREKWLRLAGVCLALLARGRE